MLKSQTGASMLAAALLIVIAAPVADAGKGARRSPDAGAHAKDCTRMNGRFGYYGNPWCTPAEQRAFDRRQAARSSAGGQKR